MKNIMKICLILLLILSLNGCSRYEFYEFSYTTNIQEKIEEKGIKFLFFPQACTYYFVLKIENSDVQLKYKLLNEIEYDKYSTGDTYILYSANQIIID